MVMICDFEPKTRVKTLDKYREKFLFGLVTVYITVEDSRATENIYSLTRYNQTISVSVLNRVVFEYKITCDRVGSFIFSEKKIENGKIIKNYLD